MMRLLHPLAAIALVLPAASHAQAGSRSATRADSALVARVLGAEDARDLRDPALAAGARHADPRISMLARRAAARIADSLFAGRDSFPALPAPPVWPEPRWRLRYRDLAGHRDDCAALRAALGDSTWMVRLRAADLAGPSCAADDSLVAALARWADSLPPRAATRAAGGVSWHAGAHAIVALARLRPALARERLVRLAAHERREPRLYAARAAAVLADTAMLRRLAADRDANVREGAISALAKLAGHADDPVYLTALRSPAAQVALAAALALDGSSRAEVRPLADSLFARWVARDNASARDVRLALLHLAGRPAGDDRPPARRPALPRDAVALALGAQRTLRVALAPASGGGSFDVRLRGDVAPIMAARILELARRGYYDRLAWHRVEPDFVIQGGSPGANEYVGNARFLRDELGTVPHRRGTVGMSTRGHDTGDAQWFVNLKDNSRLGRDYTVFGEVVRGIEVVDGILEADVIASIRPLDSAAPHPSQRSQR